MSLKDIHNLDYTILLCRKMEETWALYKDVMGFPIERDLENWGQLPGRRHATDVAARGQCLAWDDGPALSDSAAIQLAFRVPPPAVDACHADWWRRASPSSASRPIFPPGATGRCSSAIPRTTSSRSMPNIRRQRVARRPTNGGRFKEHAQMSSRVSVGLFAIAVASSFFAPSAALPQGADAAWATCIAAPNRACVLDEAMVVARAITTDGSRVYPLISIAMAHAKSGRRQEAAAASAEAMRVLNAAGEDARWRGGALGSIAAVQAKAGMTAEASATIGQALEIVESIRDVATVKEFLDFDLVAIARDQAEAGNFAEALRVARAIKSEWERAKAIGFVARGHAEAGDFAEALRLARIIAQRDTGDVLKSIADAQMKAGLKQDAAHAWVAAAKLAQSQAHRDLDVDEPVKILLSIADSQAKADLTNDAGDTFERALQAAQSIMASINMAPPPIVERIEAIIEVAGAEARAGMSSEAAAAFELARGLAGTIEQSQWKTFSPGDITAARAQWRAYSFAAIAAGQARAGLARDAAVTIEQAMPLAQSIEERVELDQPGRAHVLYLIASAQAHVGNSSAAAQIVPLISQGPFRAMAIESLAKAGAVAEALHLAPSVEDERDRSMMLASMALEPSNTGDLAGIVAVAAAIKDAYCRAHALVAVAQALAKAGQLSEAGATIDEVTRIAWSIESGIGHDQTLGQIVDQLCAVAKVLPN